MDKSSIRHSIFTRLTLFFLTIILAISVGFFYLLEDVKKQNIKTELKESDVLMLMLRRSIMFDEKKRQNFFQERGYIYTSVDENNTKGLTPAFTNIPDNFAPEIKDSMQRGLIQIMKSKTMLYVLINRKKNPFMVGVESVNPYMHWMWGGFGFLIVLIIALYLSFVYSLAPLKSLTNAIQRYGENGSYVPLKSHKKDEIAYLINAFDTAVQKNRALIDARHLFMRNVMHELKTPITVGKLSLPFLGASAENEILGRAFVRMERLIEDMAHIEEVTSLSSQVKLETCFVNELLIEAEALMLEDAGDVVYDFNIEDKLNVDFRMMVSVFKNLIDNAFKYASEKKVVVKRVNNSLHFINKGTPWSDSQNFQTLLEPFVYDDKNSTKKSFGLGLYIVKSILEVHKVDFEYFYEEGAHHFVLQNLAFTE